MKVDLQWLEAPSVQDPAERVTWAQIAFFVDGEALTELHDPRTHSVRSGFYGSALPLAEWLAEHALRLIHERRRPSPASESWFDWHEAHAFRVARSGGAMPDLVVRRTNDDVVELELRRFIQPPGIAVRFLREGVFHVRAAEFERGVFDFLRAVEERFSAMGVGAPESFAKRYARLSPGDPLAVAAARLGFDSTTRRALSDGELAIAEGSALEDDERRVNEAIRVAKTLPPPPPLTESWRALRTEVRAELAPARVPWLTGWDAAGRVRRRLGLSSSARFADLVQALGLSTDVVRASTLGTEIETVHVRAPEGPPAVVTTLEEPTAQRFRVAKGLFHGLFSGQARFIVESPLLPTPEANAFAAELMAPLAHLAEEKPPNGVWLAADLKRMATRLGASRRVIEHQIENHPEELGQVVFDAS